MARGVRNEGNPEAWIIADGKLYVFGGIKYRDIAVKDRQQLATWMRDAGLHQVDDVKLFGEKYFLVFARN